MPFQRSFITYPFRHFLFNSIIGLIDLLLGFRIGFAVFNRFYNFWSNSIYLQLLLVVGLSALFGVIFFLLFQLVYSRLIIRSSLFHIIAICIALFTCLILLYYPATLPVPKSSWHTLEIVANRTKNPAAYGSEVSIHELRGVNGEKIHFSQFEKVGTWQKVGPCCLVSNEGQPAFLRYRFASQNQGKLTLLFASQPAGGITKVRLDQVEKTIDLYEELAGTKIVQVELGQGVYSRKDKFIISTLWVINLITWVITAILIAMLGYILDKDKPKKCKWYPGFLSLALTLAFIYGSIQIAWGEKTPFAGGYHWDAVVYAQAAKNLEAAIFGNTLQTYWIQRLAPTVIVHFALRLFGIPLEDKNIIYAFEIYSLVIWLMAVFIWKLIAGELKLKEQNIWLGFILLFINHINLKLRFWLPTFSDNSAFFLGLLLVYLFLKRQQFALFLVLVIGEFTWPSVFLFGSPLFLFPRDALLPQPAQKKLNIISGVLASLGLIFLYFFPLYPPGNFQGYERGYGLIGILSLALATLFLFFTISNVTNNCELYTLRWLQNKSFWVRLTVLVATLLGIRAVVHNLENGVQFGGVSTIFQWIEVVIISPATHLPLHFLIMHVVVFGVVVYLLIFMFKDFVYEIHQWGIGAILFVCGSLIFFLNTQVRHNIHILPFFVCAIVKAVDSYEWQPRYYWSIALAAFTISKAWLPYGITDPPIYVDCNYPTLYVLCMNTGFGRVDFDYYQALVLFTIGFLLFQILKPPIHKRV